MLRLTLVTYLLPFGQKEEASVLFTRADLQIPDKNFKAEENFPTQFSRILKKTDEEAISNRQSQI